MRPWLTLLAALAAPAVAAPADQLAGQWDNEAQFAAADAALKRPPAAGAPYPWLDRQHARFIPVAVPNIAGPDARAVYVEWRSGGPDGAISRQRLWVFRPGPDGKGRMDFHAFRNAEKVSADAAVLAALTPADLVSYPEGCALPVVANRRGFTASIPDTCAITARSGRTMRLSATITLDGDSLSYAESGVLPDGSYAFLVPGGGAYRFRREGR